MAAENGAAIKVVTAGDEKGLLWGVCGRGADWIC